jgi:hypothetical protein
LITQKLTPNDLRQRYERSLFLISIYFLYISYDWSIISTDKASIAD